MTRTRAVVAAAVLAAISIGAVAARSWVESLRSESAIRGLHQELVRQIDRFTRDAGRPPDTIQELPIEYARTDGARPELSGCFDYVREADRFRLTIRAECPR